MSVGDHTAGSAAPTADLARRASSLLERALPFLGPAVALAVGLPALGRAPFDVDEAATVAAVQGTFSYVAEQALERDPARVGYLTVLRPVASWNDAEVWVRLPSVVAVAVAALAVYRLGRRLADGRVGAVASVVLASSLGVVTIGRSAGPLALALAVMLLSSALFARAVEQGHVGWWALYVAIAAFLPLTHPIAASALAAQLVALAAARRDVDLRVAVPAVGIAALECGLFLVASIVDRLDAESGAARLELEEVAVGAGLAVGWSPAVVALAGFGVVSMYRRPAAELPRWKPTLVAGLAGMPLLAVLVAGAGLPVYPRDALTAAAGGVALACGVGLVAIADRSLRLASGAAVAAVAVAAIGTAGLADRQEDWREAAVLVRSQLTGRDTVVVLPERARFALAYYAPELRPRQVGRGEAVTIVVAGDPALAVARARTAVSPPRYALLAQERAGTALVVQRWVRPGR